MTDVFPDKIPEPQAAHPTNLPRDMNGGIDYPALVQMLKQSPNLQDQADILCILLKDKWVPNILYVWNAQHSK